MSTVGFIGLGVMGMPMAKNLLAAGYPVLAFNRSPGKLRTFAEAGGGVAANVAEVARKSDVVITNLPDTPDVETVLLGENGVLDNLAPGSVVVDVSTIGPDAARRIAEAAAERGIGALDAPVSGGEQGAVAGTLSIMVGGKPETFAAALPVLQALGETIVHVGPSGSGQTVKAANQLIVAAHLGVLAEAITLLEALEVDTEAAVRVLSGGLAGSRVLDLKAEQMRTSKFDAGFRVALHHKDLGIALAAAREAGVVTPLSALAAQEIAGLFAQGNGDLDHSAVVRIVRQLSGRSPRSVTTI
jgi:2-hydroxy-3-oxopropionate reductase